MINFPQAVHNKLDRQFDWLKWPLILFMWLVIIGLVTIALPVALVWRVIEKTKGN